MREIVVEAGSRGRPASIVAVPLHVVSSDPQVGAEVFDGDRRLPSEFDHDIETGQAQIQFGIEALRAGEERRFRVHLLQASDVPTPSGEPGVEVSDTGSSVEFRIDSDLFTAYHYRAELARPCFSPLRAAGGAVVTRSYPMHETLPGEKTDHIHHRGLWVAHGDLNGVDDWSEEKGHGWVRHQEFENIQSGPFRGYLSARTHWVDKNDKLLLEERRQAMVYRLPGSTRILDVDVMLKASTGVTFGDTKEGGMCAVRVASSMDASGAGHIEDADGRVGEKQAWGKQSRWCDYSGPVAGETVGVAILDHPDNLRHPTYWHVRDYGLMTANPFGVSAFTGDSGQNGSFTLAEGEQMLFRYRVVVHHGGPHEADIEGVYSAWVDPIRAYFATEAES